MTEKLVKAKTKKKTVAKKNPNSKSTKHINKETEKQQGFFEKFMSIYFATQTRPLWIGLFLGFGYLAIRGDAITSTENLLADVFIGLSISFSGFLIIKKNEIPMWFSLQKGVQAIFFGWIILIYGIGMVIQNIIKFTTSN